MIRILTILLLTCVWFSSHAQVNIIHTIAGKDTYGFSGDNGPATDAQLKAPFKICIDKFQNIYIADAFNHRVRRIDGLTKIITTVAGTGVAGYNGDNIPATDAQLFVPQAVCLDTFGNLYIADGLNQRIRKVSANSGIISTIAGNGTTGSGGDLSLAINAQLNEPTGVFVDKQGNVYVADCVNNKVRKISFSTGIISTIAGIGVAGYSSEGIPATGSKLNGPVQVFIDNTGNILVSELYNHRVRKIDDNGIITTIAGTGVPGYTGDNGLAINAQLYKPNGLAVDKDNNVYVAEYGNGTIRKIDRTIGKISTVAGTGVVGFFGDGGLATDAKLFCSDVLLDNYGNLIIDDYENNRIRKVNGALKVNNLNHNELLFLYPNPTKGRFTVTTGINGGIISVCSCDGRVLMQQAAISSQTEVDISNEPPGVYLVYIQYGEDRYVSKILLQ